jgi:hypothetical protein
MGPASTRRSTCAWARRISCRSPAGSRRRRCWTCRRAHGATSMFMAPTMVRRLTDAAKADRSQGRGDQDHRLWRRADVPRRYRGGGGLVRTANSCRSTGRANARWRFPRSAGRRSRTAPIRAGRSGWLPSGGRSRRSRSRFRTGRAVSLPPGRDRRDHGARRAGDAGLLEERGRTAKTIVGRLADDRRCRAAGRGRIPDARRPVEGRDHLGRDEHLPPRGGGGPADPRGCARGLGRRTALRRMGGGRGGLRRHRRRAGEVDARRSTPIASTRWRGSSGRRTISPCRTCPRTTTARC